MKEKFSNNKKEYESIWGDSIQTSTNDNEGSIQSTDEAFMSHFNQNTEFLEPPTNPVASILTFISIVIFVVGFAAGTIWCFAAMLNDSSVVGALLFLCGTFVTGTMFLGFAEIIKLLNSINYKIK